MRMKQLREYLDLATLITHQKFILKLFKNQIYKIWCPGTDCYEELFRRGTAKGVSCRKCKLWVCVDCGEWFHGDTDCNEAEELTEKKRASEREMAEEFEKWKLTSNIVLKMCPGCGALIERTDGCSHMTCSVCRHQFCFLCLKPTQQTHCR